MAQKKRLIDTSKMRVLHKDKSAEAHRIEFLDRIEDKGETVVQHTVYQITWLDAEGKQVGEIHQHRHKSVRQKLLCIGGPFAGTTQADPGKDYRSFNAATHQRGSPRCVWIHRSLLVR
jgi:hypothetical protein